jgi:sugar lactone lactonase YvrE
MFLFPFNLRSNLAISFKVAIVSSLGAAALSLAEKARAGAGDLFATDAVNNSVVVYALDGTMRTFASGLNNPQGLAFDQFGNLFVADKGSGNIYKYTADATRSTFATGVSDPVGLTFSGMALAVAEQSDETISRIETDGSKTTFMSIATPSGLAFQLPNVYVVNSASLITIAPDNSTTTFPAAGSRAVAVNNLFNAFVSTDAGDILRIAPDGTTGTFASGIADPNGLAFRPKRYSDTEAGVGNLFVADTAGGMIHEFTPDGTGSIFASGFNPNFLAFELILPGKLFNISTRLRALTGDNVLIGGFIITGDTPKDVILRAIGPSLADATPPVSGVLADPILELHMPDGTVVTNDNWKDTQEAEIEATGIAPTNDLESAIVATLDPGDYTAIVRGKDGGVGIAMVEAYDLAPVTGELGNISTRGFVDTGDNCMIGGFLIDPLQSSRVLVRGIGPTLAAFGVPDPLQDPTLELHDGNGTLINSNDNWKDTAEGEIQATGIAPTDDRESAILANLMGGAYTAIVQGKDASMGVALVEVYHLP